MKVTPSLWETRGETIVALLTVELPHEPGARSFVTFVRLGHRDGRIEQWAQCDADDEATAIERFNRACDDFVRPAPFVPSSPTNEPPDSEPSFVEGGT